MKNVYALVQALAIALLLGSLGPSALAQPGGLDPSFDPVDPAWGDGTGFDHEVMSQAVQADGRVIMGGDFTTYNGETAGRIIRLLPHGIKDPSFDPGSGFSGSGAGYVQALAIQGDGKVLVGGAFDAFDGAPCDNLVRLNTDGSLDPSFVTPIGSGGSVLTIVLQPDGRILVGGNIPGNLMRLNSDGTLDNSFDSGGAFYGYVSSIALQPDGHLIVGGAFGDYNGTGPGQIVRLNSDGTHDPTFAPAFGFDGFVNCLALLPDGDVYVGGDFLTYDGISRPHLARLNSNGTLDAAFEVDQPIPDTSTVYAVAVTPVGSQHRVIVGGSFDYAIGRRLMALHSNGDPDYWLGTFGSGRIEGLFVESIVRQPDGALLVGGWFHSCLNEPRGNSVRISGGGGMDHNFNYAIGLQQFNYTGYNGQVNALALQPDGKVIAGGHFDAYNGVPCPHLVRLNTDGTRDPSFTPPTMGVVQCLTFRSDGRVLVGGDNFLLCLLPDGTTDPTFDPGTGPTGSVRVITIQPNGRLLVGGNFRGFNGAPKPCITRLMPDGVLDGSFDVLQLDPDTVRMSGVNAIVVQPNGRIVIGGRFWQLADLSIAANIQRLFANGSVDPSFNTGWGLDAGYPNSGEVQGLLLYPDGRVLAYGGFSYYDNDHLLMDGVPRNGIALMNANGSLDLDFAPQGVNYALRSMVRLPSGEFLIGGDFTEVDGVPRAQLARLLWNGTVDNTFDPGSGVEGWSTASTVQVIAPQPDGDLLIGGEFVKYDGTWRGNIARVLGSPAGCQPSQLTTTADPVMSCGAVDLKLDGTSTIAATEVPGANRYQFLFTNTTGQPDYYRMIAWPARTFVLERWYHYPLKPGRTYNVFVRASFDNGATWCAWGPACTVKISWTPLSAAQDRSSDATAGDIVKRIYPDPSTDGVIHIALATEAVGTVTDVAVYDLTGRSVMTSGATPGPDDLSGVLRIELAPELRNGVYIVSVHTAIGARSGRFVLAR